MTRNRAQRWIATAELLAVKIVLPAAAIAVLFVFVAYAGRRWMGM